MNYIGLTQKRQVAAADGASCPVTPEPIDVQLRKSYNTRYRSKLRYFSVTIEFDSMTV